jgi:hypothetical protein
MLAEQGYRKGQVAGSRLEIKQWPSDHRSLRGKLEDPLGGKYSATLEVIACQIEHEMVP